MTPLDRIDAPPAHRARPEHASPQAIRAALLRKALADARQRSALARRLNLTDTEVLAIQQLARAGALTPGQLASLLQLSSGGTTGLIQRLERSGHAERAANGRDRRSTLVSLTPSIRAWTAEAWAPLVEEIDALVLGLSEHERAVFTRLLELVADAAERHADRISRDADEATHDALVVALPALWA
jgi:DNA-binding MarR family transcriptional regulator